MLQDLKTTHRCLEPPAELLDHGTPVAALSLRRALLGFFAAIALAGAVLGRPAIAESALPPEIGSFGSLGSGAGQFQNIFALETNPDNGHIYAVDGLPNERIVEFTAWGEFVRAWGWGVRDGSPELQTCGPQALPPSPDCGPGTVGEAAGQFDRPIGIALDSTGNIYVFERFNLRVQKFSPSGDFLLMFGGGVNKTTGENVCTATDLEAGDECGAGSSGGGDGEFSVPILAQGDYIDVGPEDTVYVGDQDRIQKFDTSGKFLGEIALPQPGEPGSLAVDPSSESVYFAFNPVPPVKEGVYRLNAGTGAVEAKLPAKSPKAVVVDAAGTVWISETVDARPLVISYASTGEPVIPASASFAYPPKGPGDPQQPLITALGVNTVTHAGDVALYVAIQKGGLIVAPYRIIRFYGAAPDKWPPPLRPPGIDAQYATAVGTSTATVKAKINPRFWSDTRFYVEYGPEPCKDGGCAPVEDPPGRLLGAGIVSASVMTPGISLSGLQPGTRYHFRFVAESSGGKAVGQGDEEVEGTFKTFAAPTNDPNTCPNALYRKGPGAHLPDCRAYEMVTPIDKNDSDIAVQCNSLCQVTRLDQAATSGGAFTYSSYRAFGDQPGAPYSSQYIARRGSNGWTSQGINPPREGASSAPTLDVQYRYFAPDLSEGLLIQATDPLLAPGAVSRYPNLYRRNLLKGGYEALTTTQPIDQEPKDFEIQVQGVSEDQRHIVFRAAGKLTPNAPATGAMQTYEYFNGQLRLVSVRPNGTASPVGSSLGYSNLGVQRRATLNYALSADGSRAFWTESATGAGKLYVRINGAVTKLISNQPARFFAAAKDGSKVAYRNDTTSTLVLHDVEGDTAESIAPEVIGVAGASDDLERIYFASRADLDGGAEPGSPNLYLYEEGMGTRFIATLAEADVSASSLTNPVAAAAEWHTSRVTPDGRTLVFMSLGQPTGFDNVDAVADVPTTQVYLYDSEADELICLSCNPSGARPTGQVYVTPGGDKTDLWSAARIPGYEGELFAPRVLVDSGNRVFFDSYESLVLRDTNGARDVYQWERVGVGSCSEESNDYRSEVAGCISILSTGQDPGGAEFLDATADGSEVFFATAQSLVSQDPQYIDIYAARVNGGFASPPASANPCSGEECQQLSLAPPFEAPGSQVFRGRAPRAKHANQKRRCGKGKRRVVRGGKPRCVKRSVGARNGNKNRRAGKSKAKKRSRR